jgi:hypothetical protein
MFKQQMHKAFITIYLFHVTPTYFNTYHYQGAVLCSSYKTTECNQLSHVAVTFTGIGPSGDIKPDKHV